MAQPLSYVPATVQRSRGVTPRLLRLELEWDAGHALRRCGRSDEALVLCVPDAEGDLTVAPERSRWYTVRAADDGLRRLTVDVVQHGGGAVSTWAAAARPGARCAVSSTMGWYTPPATTTRQLLVGDLTALPAMARIAAESAGRRSTRILAEVGDAADEAYLAGSPAEVTYLHNRHQASGSRLAEAVRALGTVDTTGGYVYAAGETAAMRAVRRHLRHVLGLPREGYGVIGYWTVDADRWRALWDVHGDELAALYADVDAPGADREAVLDRYDRRLDELSADGG